MEEEDGFNHGFKQTDNKAVLRMESGTTIDCQRHTQVSIAGGTLELAQVGTGVQKDIRIEENSQFNDKPLAWAFAKLVIGSSGTLKRAENPTVPVALRVDGEFYMFGTLEMYANRTEISNDQIIATYRVTLGDVSTLRMKWFDNTGSLPPLLSYWTLIKSEYTGLLPAISNSSHFVPPSLLIGEVLTPLLAENNTELRVYVEPAS